MKQADQRMVLDSSQSNGQSELTLESLKNHLPRTTFQRIAAVADRIRSILVARAVCIAWLVLVSATLIVIAIDAWFMMTLATRWLLAIALFGCTIGTFIWTLLPRLRLVASPRWVARVIESAAPQVRNRLLSALDLASEPLARSARLAGADGSQSTALPLGHNFEFVDAFQSQVAGRMESIAPHHVLSWRSVRGWILNAILVAAIVGGLMFVPQLSLAKRIARAWFPSVNIGRLVAYEMVIEPPRSPWIEIRNDLFAVEAKAVVGSPKSMQLEIQSEDGDIRTLQMQTAADDAHRFLQNLSIDAAAAKLRVVAFDSASPWYSVELVDRPVLSPKSITLYPPEYARVPPETIEDWNGSIQCVKGTRVELNFQSPSLIRSGELIFEKSDKTAASLQGDIGTPKNIPLQVKSQGQQVADFVVWNSGRYVIKAVDDRTEKESDTTRSYSVDSPNDRAPRLTWKIDQPGRAKFIASHELVPLSLEYIDEFPLDKLQVQYSLDQAEWQNVDIALTENNTGLVGWTLDPLALGVQNSQLVEVRFVAVDRKKQSTTSSQTQWMVSNSYTAASRWNLLEKRFEIIASLRAASQKWQDWMAASDDLWQKAQDKTLSHLQSLPFSAETFDELHGELSEVAKESTDFVEQDSSIDLALYLFRIAKYQVPQLKARIDAANEKSSPEELNQLRNEAREIAKEMRVCVGAAYQMLGEDVLIAANQDMNSIIDSQSNLQDSSKSLSADQVRNRQAAIGSVLANLLERLLHFANAFEPSSQSAFILQLRNLRQTQSSIAASTGRNLLQNNQYWQSDESRRWIGQTLQQMQNYQRLHTLQDGFFGQHRDNRRALNPHSANWVEPMYTLRHLIEKIVQEPNMHSRLSKIVDYQRDVKSLEAMLEQSRAMETIRINLDRFYLSDSGNIRRAMLNVTREEYGDFKAQFTAMDEIANAASVLSAAHRMKVAADEANWILQIESNMKSLDATLRAEQPRNIADMNYHIESSRDRSHQLQLVEPVRKAWEKASWGPAMQLISDSMNNRRWSRDPIQHVAGGLRDLLETMDQALMDNEPRVIAARDTIAKYVPKVSELAKKASQKVDQAKKTAAKDAKEKNKENRDQANKAVDNVKQSLQDLASIQNLLSEEQAKVARDADRALQSLDKAAKKAEASAQQFEQIAESSSDAAKAAQQNVVQAQEALKSTLDKIAEHFQQIEQGQAPDKPFSGDANSDQEPAQSQQQAQDDQQPEQEDEDAYKEAEFLRELASMTPEALLKKLENELPKRTGMQNSLKQINLQNLQQTLSTLSSVSAKQRSLTRELEISDPVTQAQLDTSVEQMHQISRLLHKLNDQQVNWTLQSTGRAQLSKIQEKMNEAKSDLTKLANQFSSVNGERTMFELNQMASDLKQKAHGLQQEFAEVAKNVKDTEALPVAADERQLQNLQREANDWQTRYRRENENWLQGEVRHRTNHKEHLSQQINGRQNQVNDANQRLNREREQFEKSKKEPHMRQQVQRAEQDVQFSQRELDATKLRVDAASSMVDRASQLHQTAQGLQQAELPLVNPHLGLAKNFSQQSSDFLDDVVKDIDQLAKNIEEFSPPLARGENAKSVAEKQSTLVNDMQRSQRDLNRSARHSQRVENEPDATQLKEMATESGQVASEQMQASASTLQKAAAPSAPNELTQARIDGEAAKSAVGQMRQAQSELSKIKSQVDEVATELRQQVASQADSQTPQAAPPKSAPPITPNMFTPNFTDYMSEGEMARLLDDLDHIVYDSKRAQDQQGDQDSEQSGSEKGQQSGDNQNASNDPSKQGQNSGSSGKGKQAVQSSANQLADMLAQMRSMSQDQNSQSQGNQKSKSQQSNSASSKSMSTSPASGKVQVPESDEGGEASEPAPYADDVKLNKNWANLRVSKLEEGTGQSRQGSASPYKSSIDAYFKALSKLKSNQ